MYAQNTDDEQSVEIADQVYWVGFAEGGTGIHCNPYLLVDGKEAVLIDSGTRDDFSTVMLKIMRTGIAPGQIRHLICHHYGPDTCGNIPHMEAIVSSPDLKIISHRENNIFINCYSMKSSKLCIESMEYQFTFQSGRRLIFIRTPYAHAPGSFVTYDTKTKILFSGDLFGSYDQHWRLYTRLFKECAYCSPQSICPATQKRCEMMGILDFHRRVMTSKKALDHALSQIEKLDISMIAPQHGSLLDTPAAQRAAIRQLYALSGVGIDGVEGRPL